MKNKCSKTEHVFEQGQRKCICGKADIYWLNCSMCGNPNLVRNPGMTCDDCMESEEFKQKMQRMKEEDAKRPPMFSVKTFRDPVAFGYDKKTGQPLAIDKKGRTFDPEKTRYNKPNDPHGWKATDKVKPKKETII